VRKAHDRRFVQVVDDLGIEPVAVNRDRFEVALVQKRADEVGHVVLRSFQGEEDRGLIRVGKARGLSAQGPEQIAHAAGETTHRGRSGIAARAALRAGEQVEVRLLERPLRGEHKDRVARDTGLEKRAEAQYAGSGLAGPGGAGEEDPGIGRSLDDGALVRRGLDTSHESRLADCEAFVNQGVKTARAAALAALFVNRG
jgi:hypothetical protein